jgi:dipeptidyl aminopeptidase/acylaminoacyl peptidase
MNRLTLALAGWALAACQTVAPASPAPTTPSTASMEPLPSPSPAANLIAFARGTSDGAQLEVVDETGGVLRPINSPDLEVPRWSPDGEWIAAVREEPDHDVHVSLVRADGSGYHELHPDPTLNLGVVAWTPDGEWIACEAWDPTDKTRDGIYIVKVADGSGLARIAPRGIPGSFSADGKRLVFSVEDGKGHRLAVVNIDGTGFAMLGSENVEAYPGFMPDGTLYDAIADKMGVFDLEGTLLRTFAAPSGTINEARLSPNGKRFVFAHFGPSDYAAIATISVDGTDLEIVVPAIQGEDALHSEQGTPDWQP